MPRIRFDFESLALEAELLDTPTARALAEKLPLDTIGPCFRRVGNKGARRRQPAKFWFIRPVGAESIGPFQGPMV